MQKIFIGDVQGCGDELETLATRARETFGRDFELWSVGDLINRGPKNLLALGVMRELCDEGLGRVVAGNHEIGLLRVWLGLKDLDPKNTYPEILDDSSCNEWIEWIRELPLALRGDISGKKFAMVHAAMHPDWSLAELDTKARRIEARLSSPNIEDVNALLRPEIDTSDESLNEDRDSLGLLTRCRSLDPNDRWSKAQPKGDSRPWHEAWSERGHDFGIVYGHWSLQGLHVAPGLRGLDTGCVHNGRGRVGFLTGWLPKCDEPSTSGIDPFAAPDDSFWQIPAQGHYYD